ncbi:MAG: hypothetical protein A3G25_13420 [Betaproteobacteria bacterium RIFCSPLOWO2_12_FULL_63_13]|nr:MAG: hypothetical protein A3G25_13420 [Betaproteobacteria bacterium RIFCSPLOWO2_12_FULL_63_13]
MSFAQEYIDQLKRFAARSAPPRVRALHLPPRHVPGGDNRGEFCALELEDGSLGMSYVLLGNTLDELHEGHERFGLAGADALDLAQRYVRGDGIVRTLGFAAANSLTRCFFDRTGYLPDTSADSIGQLNPQAAERIGMVGLFTPLIERIVKSGAELIVVELKSRLIGDRERYRVTLDAGELDSCSKVITTSTLLLNDTLDNVLSHCRHAQWVAMIGPSAGCLPDALFSRGVTLVGGSWIHNREGFLDSLRRGEPTSIYTRKFVIGAADYPGFERLLARL